MWEERVGCGWVGGAVPCRCQDAGLAWSVGDYGPTATGVVCWLGCWRAGGLCGRCALLNPGSGVQAVECRRGVYVGEREVTARCDVCMRSERAWAGSAVGAAGAWCGVQDVTLRHCL